MVNGMIDPLSPQHADVLHQKQRPVLKMIASDRMAGSIPAWVPAENAQEEVLNAISTASGDRSFGDVLSDALSYRPDEGQARTINQEPFGFGDLIDIVNPLHHIPLVGSLYRHVSGDDIRSSSKIFGGAVFGGAIGAASGLVNLIVEEETGRDIAGNMVAMISGDRSEIVTPDDPQARLAHAGDGTLPAIPGAALGFVDMGGNRVSALPARQIWKFNE